MAKITNGHSFLEYVLHRLSSLDTPSFPQASERILETGSLEEEKAGL